MMDYSLPVSKRTRLRAAEVYKRLHDEIRKGRNQGKESNAAVTGSTNGLNVAQEESVGGSSYKGSKSSVVLDDSEDDVFLDDSEKGDVVSVHDSDDDDQSEGVESESFDVAGKKSGGTDVGGSYSGVKSDGEESGRSRVPLPRWQRTVSESYNGDVFAHERNEGGVCFLSSGIGNGSGGVGLKGRESNGVAGRTELQSGFCEKNKDGNVVVVVVVDDDDDDACVVLERDAEELQSSSSGEEETFKDDGDHRVELPESFTVEEEEEGEEDGDREQGEMELKRNKVGGIEGLCNSDIGKIEISDFDTDDFFCVAKRTRSHNNLESAKKRMKLETVSRPLCVDEEKLDDNGDNDEDDNGDNDEDDTETYEAVDLAKKVRSKKGKGKPTGGGDGDETCDHRSRRMITESRKGSGGEHGLGVCRRKPSKRRRKEYVVKILANSLFLDQEDVPFKEEREPLEEPVLPLKFTFGIEESSPPVKSEEEKQLEELWADMALALCLKDTTDDATLDENEDDAHEVRLDTTTLCRQGNHELYLDEEIGLLCKYCSFVDLEIKYYVPPFQDRYPRGKSARRDFVTMQYNIFNELQYQDYGHDTDYDPSTLAQGTVWNLIPGIGKGMHGHQREGFEFLWKNIAGGICLDKLKENTNLNGGTGCIISHAPGTGKTRLTIVFLQTYMQLYPTSRPVIVAPCSMLLTWEAEFLKWGVDIPFHIVNKKNLSGKENRTAMDLFRELKPVERGINVIRMVKLYSWKKERSILGISYKLFEELVSEEKSKTKISDTTGDDQVRKVLLELPGLLVLDEGHTPRNDRSHIWKALSKVQTQKRIILSGTPFQNNFDELYNTLCLVKPKFADEISSKRQRAFPKRRGRKRNTDARRNWASLTTAISKVTDDKLEAQRVEELRKIIRKFVHVHKGGVLRERLPGLRDSVVILEPVHLQKTLLENVKQINGLDHFEMLYLLSVLSVHPSLLPEKSVGTLELKFVDLIELEMLRSKPEAGVKTKFLMELIRLCQARNEKVLVFSQYLEPLNLVIKQLESNFSWIQGEDLLYMHGKLKIDERQTLIKHFNNANSKAKVLLASTRACSEGINLVGASRVVLLDVLWNPSVERQAISRAYRLGQEKVVYVYHLITSGTMEEEKYMCQVEKERLSELVFDCTNRSSSHQKGVSDITDDKKDKILEEMVQLDKLKPMFKKVVYQPKDTNLVKSFDLDL